MDFEPAFSRAGFLLGFHYGHYDAGMQGINDCIDRIRKSK